MTVQTGQTVVFLFTTRTFSTGVGINADATPTGILYINGTASGNAVTVTGISTGLYKGSVVMPTLALGDEVEVIISATVGGISDKAVVWGDTNDLLVETTGYVKSSMYQILGTGLTETVAGYIATGFKQFFNVATPTSTMNQITNAPSAGDFTATMKTAIPTAVAIRTEMDSNSTKLANLDATISSRNATTPPTVAQITTAIFTDLMSSTDMNTVGSFGALIKSYINAAIGNIPTTPLLASNYVVPPTAVAIRTEMDSNSTKLSNLDATISSRNATTPPTAVAIRTEMDSNSTKLSNLDATVSSRLATNAYTSPNNAQISVIYNKLPTNNIADQNFLATQIGTPVQTGATVNANLIQVLGTALTQTLAGYLAAGISYFFNVSTPTQTMNTTGGGGSGPTVEQIATRLLLTPANKLATNTDGSVNVSGGTVNVQVLSNFNRDGTRLKLVRGNDYAAANNNLLTFSITNRPELIGTTAHLRFYGQRLDACVSTTITNATQTVTMGDMLSDYTNQFAGGSEVQYQLNFLTPAGLTNTVINGLATIIQKC